MKSRFLAFTLGIIIGGTYTFIYLTAPQVFKPCIKTIEIHNASAEAPKREIKKYPEKKKDIKSLVIKYFGKDAPTALKIMKAESGGNPKAIHKNKNGTIDTGLLQVNSVHGYSKEFLLDPENNIKVAKKIFDKQGWNAWATYRYAKRHNLPI